MNNKTIKNSNIIIKNSSQEETECKRSTIIHSPLSGRIAVAQSITNRTGLLGLLLEIWHDKIFPCLTIRDICTFSKVCTQAKLIYNATPDRPCCIDFNISNTDTLLDILPKIQKESNLSLEIIFSENFEEDIGLLTSFLDSNTLLKITTLDFPKTDVDNDAKALAITTFLANVTYLKTLSFASISDITLDLSQCIFPRLERLTFKDIDGSTVLFPELGNLKELVLERVRSDDFNLSQCIFPKLERLTCEQMLGTVFIPQQLDNLKELVLGNVWITGGGETFDLSQYIFPKLERLTLKDTIFSPILLPRQLNNLTEITLGDIKHYGNVDLSQCIFPKLMRLTHGNPIGGGILILSPEQQSIVTQK